MTNFLKSNVTLVNYAQPTYSTKIFLRSAEYDNMLLIKPDYVLMQFGWSDGAVDPVNGTSLPEFRTNLHTLVNAVRGFNGIPIFVTLHAARAFDAQGKIIRTIQYHRDIKIPVAAELNVPLIDLYQLSLDLFEKLGPEGCEFMLYDPRNNRQDVMHVSVLGSAWISQLVVNQLPDSLGPYLTNIFEPQRRP